jgi:hypothetical protein
MSELSLHAVTSHNKYSQLSLGEQKLLRMCVGMTCGLLRVFCNICIVMPTMYMVLDLWDILYTQCIIRFIP